MKALILLGLLAPTALAQSTPPPFHVENNVSALTVTFGGQQAGSYQVNILNKSSHAVTAFVLRLVPAGIPKVEGHYACEGSCGRSIVLADNASPAIKSREVVQKNVAVARVEGGAVVVEAAIFDDESFEGEERAAAFLLAAQIGRQGEYDRLIPAVRKVTTSQDDDQGKIAQLRISLEALPMNLDPGMVQTFDRWFPELAACIKPYARVMKNTAARERQFVLGNLEQFASRTAPGKLSFTQWWNSIMQQLSTYGCNGCMAQAMRPRTAAQDVSLGCQSADLPVIYTASLDDGGDEEGGEEAESNLSPEDVEVIARNVRAPQPRPDSARPVKQKAAELSSSRTEAAMKTDVLPQSKSVARPPEQSRVADVPPSGLPFTPAPGGKGWLLSRMKFGRPLPRSVIFRAFFRDVGSFQEQAFEEAPLWQDGKFVESHGPRAGGLSKAELAIVTQASAGCNRQLANLFSQTEKLLRSSLPNYPGGWLLYAPPLPGLSELNRQETAALNASIDRLRLKLGKASYSRLESFVRKVYDAPPGHLTPVDPPADAVYSRFLEYVAKLQELSARNQAGNVEWNRRQAELRSIGLRDKDLELLKTGAKEYNTYIDRLQAPFSGALAAPAIPASLPLTPAAPARPLTPTTGKRAQEQERRIDEAQLNLLTQMAQLEAGLGEPRFHQFGSYLHRLYPAAAMQRMVAVAGPEPRETAKRGGNQKGVPQGSRKTSGTKPSSGAKPAKIKPAALPATL